MQCFMEGKELVFFNIAATGNDLTKDKLKNYLQLMLMTRKGGKEFKDPVTADSTLAGVSDINEASTDSVLYYHMNEEKLISYIATEKSAKNTLRLFVLKQHQLNQRNEQTHTCTGSKSRP
jgi:hypothetical protein